MGVIVNFTSGKKPKMYKNATYYREYPKVRFKGQNGQGYTAPGYVIGGFPSGKTVRYNKSKVSSIRVV